MYKCIFIKDGNTPLHWAAEYGHLAIVEHLEKNGGDIKATNEVYKILLSI